MRKLEPADPDVMRIAIQQEVARSDEPRYDDRLQGLLLLTGGQSRQQVADLFGEDRRCVAGATDSKPTGWRVCVKASIQDGRPRWMPSNGQPWDATCDATPRKFGHAGHLWGGKHLSERLRLRIRRQAWRASVPANLWTDELPDAQAQTASGSIRPGKGRGCKKHCADWQDVGTLNYGAWTNAISNSMAPGAECGADRGQGPVVLHAPTRKSVACSGAARAANAWWSYSTTPSTAVLPRLCGIIYDAMFSFRSLEELNI